MADGKKSARHEEVWSRVKEYIPFLRDLISYYKNSSQQNRQQQLQKLTTMYDLLTNKKLNSESLCKCEKVLQKLYETNPLKRELTKLDTSHSSLDTPASPTSPDASDKEPTTDAERIEKTGDSNKNDGATGKAPLSLDEIQRLITEKNESSNVRAAINNTLNVLKGARIPTITCDGSLRPNEAALSQQNRFTNDYWPNESETFDTFPHAVNPNYRPVSYNNIDLTPGPSKSPPLYRRRVDLAVQDTLILNERMDISPSDDQPLQAIAPPMIKDPRLRKSVAFTSNLPTPPDPVFPPKSNDPRLNRPPLPVQPPPLPVQPPPPNDLPKCVAPNPNLPLQLPKRRLSICANQVIIEEIPPEPVIPVVKSFPVRRPSTCSEIYDRSFQNAPFIPPPPTKPTPPVLTPPITPVYPLQSPFEVPSFSERDPRRNHLAHGSEFTKPPQSSLRNAGSFSNTPTTYAEYRRQKEMRESLANERNKFEKGDEQDRIREQEKKLSTEAESTIGMVPNNNRVAAKAYAKPAKCFVQKERRFAPQLPQKDKDREDTNASKPYSHDKKRDGRAEKDQVKPVPKSKDLFGEQLSQFDKMYRSGDFSKKPPKPNIDKFKIPKIRRVGNHEDSVNHNEEIQNPKDSVASQPPQTTKESKAKSTSTETSQISSNKKKQKKNIVTKPEHLEPKTSTLADDDLWDDDDVPSTRPESPKPIPPTETKTVQKAIEKPVFQAPSLPAPRRIMTRRYSMAIEQKNLEESRESDLSPATASMPPMMRKITRRRNSIAVSQLEKKLGKEPEKPKLLDNEDEDVEKPSRRGRKRRVILDDDDDDNNVEQASSESSGKEAMPEPEPIEPVTAVVVTAEDTSDNVVSSTTSESTKVSESIVNDSIVGDNDEQQKSDSTNDCESAIANSSEDELKTAHQNAKDTDSNPDNKAQLLAMLSTMVTDEKKLKKIREIIDGPGDKSIPNEQDQKKEVSVPVDQLQTLPNEQKQTDESENREEPAAAANDFREKEKVTRKGKKSEIDKLNADIADMFIRDGVLNAYGKRSCTQKTADSPKPQPPKKVVPGPSRVAKPASSKKGTEVESSKTAPSKEKSDLEVSKVPLTEEETDLHDKLRNFRVVVKKLNIAELGVNVGISSPSNRVEDGLEDDVVSVASSGVSVSPKSKKRKRSAWAVGLVKRKKKKLAAKEQNNAASSPIKTYAPKPVTKNTHRDLHCSNDKSRNCALCFYVGPLTTIVQHYVRNHPLHEVYTSRVPTLVANKLKKEPMQVSGSIHDQNITFQCIFCQEKLSKTKYNWKLHLASHTGEYRYKCNNCTIKSLTPCTYSHDSECSGSSMEVVNELLFEENHIYAYMCRLCNFVQLSRDNMKAHLREEHDRQMTGKGTLQFSVLNYARDEEPPCESPKSQESPLESDVSMPELTPQVPDQNQQSDMSAFIPTANEEIESLRVLNDRTLLSPPKSSIVDKMIDRINATKTSNDDDWEDIDSPAKESENNGVSSEHALKVRRSLHAFEEVLLPQEPEQDEEPVDLFKNRQMVSNVGYNKISDDVWYLCLIGGCKYSTLIRSEMYTHVSEQHSSIIWDGFCHLCTAQVIEDDSNDLCKEVKHMAVIHIKDRSAIDDLNTSVTSIMPPVSNEDRSTMLKLRRFSSDKLSIGTPPQDQVQTDFEEAPPNVKPWLNDATTKQRNHCLNMLEPKSLYCFYKCMATSCCFTTPLETMMEKHLDNHELVGDATGSITSRSWLECAYCEVVSETKADLLRHLKAVHASSTHQCAYCFYRSRDAYSVILHQKLHHTKEKQQILVMDLVKKPLLVNEQEALNRRRFENISPLICTVCKAKFCVLDAFMTHLKEAHADMKTIACQCCQELVLKQKIPRHLLVHKIGIYECIYCQYGTDTIDAIQLHVCNKHPMEPFYCCVRFNKATGKVMEATLKSLYDKAIDEQIFVCCPFSQEQLSYKSADTKSNHDISHGTKPTVIPLQLPPIRVGNTNILLSAQIPSSSSSSEAAVPKQAVMVNSHAVIKIPTISSVSGGVALLAASTTPVPVITAVHENYQPAITSPTASTSMPVISRVVGGVAATAEALAGGSSSMPVITRVEGGIATVATAKPVPSLVPAQDESLMLEAERIALEMIKDTGLPKSHLYRCIFKGCNQPILPDGTGMRNHLMYCHLQAGQYICSHCKKQNTFTTVATFIQHLKSHEAQRVFCFVCDYKASFPQDVMKHVKEVHKASKPAMLYLNPQKNNPNNDIILFAPAVPSEADIKAYYRKLIDLYNHKLQIALLQQKTHFTPEECEALPKQAIFSQIIFCSKCQYSTQVRQNMYRHLKGHLNDLPVSNVDPKNPVPCWGQGEKHFDRMRNPAASSQEDDDLIQSLCFVQESKRYICGAPDCRHLTTNELMLQNHLVTLHADVREYKCPHCPAVHIFAGQLNPSKVLDHLKLHDKELYRCSLCQIFLNNSNQMNQHIAVKHPKTANATLLVIRDGSTAGSVAGSSADHEVLFKWKCDICKFKGVTLAEIRAHMKEMHNNDAKYRCSRCLFSCSKKALFAGHFEKQHPGCDIVIISLYKQIDGADSRADTTPLWRREVSKTKSIRGIMLEMDDNEVDEDEDEFVEVNGLDSGLATTGVTIRKRKSLEDEKESNVAVKRPKSEEITAVKAFKCGFRGCAYMDDFGAGIVSHFRSDHPNEKPSVLRNSMANPAQSRFDYFLKYACYYCIRKADTIHDLLEHWMQMHRISGLRSQDKPFLFRASKIILCFYCRKGAQMPEMKSHYSTYHPDEQPIYLDFRNPKQCAECDFVMGANRQEMVQHFAAKHKVENEYSRGWIDFLTDDILDKILKLNSTMYGCGKCAFASVKPSDFDGHYAAAHPGHPVAFNAHPLVQHITYHCAYNNCKSQLTDERSLAQHILFHVPVFKCCFPSGGLQCNVQFRTFTMLWEHFKTTHPNEDMQYALKAPEEYKQVLRMITLQFWNGFMMSLEDARQAGNKYGSNDGIFKLVEQMCQDAVIAETQALQQ